MQPGLVVPATLLDNDQNRPTVSRTAHIVGTNGKVFVVQPSLFRIPLGEELVANSVRRVLEPDENQVVPDSKTSAVESEEMVEKLPAVGSIPIQTEQPLSDRVSEKERVQEDFKANVKKSTATTETKHGLNPPSQGQELKPLKFARSRPMRQLKAKIQRTLKEYYPRHLNTRDHCPWAIMHSFIAFGVDTQLYADRPGGKRMSAIGWLCYNGLSGRSRLFSISDGQIDPRTGPGVQGHEGQFLAMLAQSRVRNDYPMRIDANQLTVQDLIDYEQATCYRGTELTFKLIALSHYIDHGTQWKNDKGETWDVGEILKEELEQPIRGAACGGTHRLMGFSYAVRTHVQSGKQLDGQWLRAQKFVDQYHKYALSQQNKDGSFSCNWFKGTGRWCDEQRKVQTTGHILEWLIYSLPENRLGDRRIIRAVNFMASLLYEKRYDKLEVGPQGHALHALVLYEHRVFGQPFGQRRMRYIGSKDSKSTASQMTQS